jgi:NitT/TauT family transport system substrate-binding protein
MMASTSSRLSFLARTAAGGAVFAGGLPARRASAATTMRVCYIPIVDVLPLFVGVDQGLFKKRDLDVSLIPVANQGVLISSLTSGSAEIGSSVLVSMLPAQEAGIALAAIAGCVKFPVPHNSGVLARAGSGIKSAKDLAGRKIAVAALKSYSHILTLRWLAEKNVDATHITFVEVPFPQMPDVLKLGQIDAVVAVDPFYHRIIDANTGYQFDDFQATVPDGTLIDCYTAMKSWATANVSAVHAFRDGLQEAISYLHTHEPAARESLGRWTKQPPEIIASTPIPQYAVPVSAGQVQWWIDLAKKQGLISGTVKATDLLVS